MTPRNITVRVSQQGMVTLPLLGEISVMGLTVHAVEQVLRERYDEYIYTPQVGVLITEFHSFRVSVIGAVNRVGVFDLKGPKTLIDVLALAGGVNPRAGNRVHIYRQGPDGRESHVFDLFALARANGATIFVPSGAIAGLDGVASATAGRIDSVTMVTRKPPEALRGAPGVTMAGVDLDAISEPTLVYEGPVREACRRFPANVNVSAALSMAGIGPDRTTIRIYADPHVTRNTHEIVVEGEFGRLAINIENVPSPANPKTGLLSALSAGSTLKRITSTVRIGT